MSRACTRIALIALIALMVAVPQNLTGVQQSPGSYDFLIGTWEGELEYLDYGDSRTLVRLATRLVCTRSDDAEGLTLVYSFEEPNGSVVTSTERLYETPDGLYLDGGWQIEARSDDTAGGHRLVLTQRGEDNGRPAAIRNTIIADGGGLTITKSVLYDDTGERLQRNQFRFERVPAGAATLQERIDVFDPTTGAFVGSERTWFAPRGGRLRLEVTDAEDELTLLFIVRLDRQDRESEAIYFEDGSSEASREVFTYSESGRLKTTMYYYEPGVPADRTESELDATMREVRKRYYRADGSQYGEEDVRWDDGGLKAGWDFRYVGREGGASFRYSYEELSDDGQWVRRVRSRNGEPERVEVRSRITGSVNAGAVHPVPFAPGRVSSAKSETSPSFSRDGKTMVFARYGDDWSVKPLPGMGPVYNLAISPDANTVIYATRSGDDVTLHRVHRADGAWSMPENLSDHYRIRGSYPDLTESGDLLFFDAEGESGAGIYTARRAGGGFATPVPLYTPEAGDSFDAYALDEPSSLLVTRCFDEACLSGPQNGIWMVRLDDSGVWRGEKLADLPYAWGVQAVEALGLLVFTDGEDILAVPLSVGHSGAS